MDMHKLAANSFSFGCVLTFHLLIKWFIFMFLLIFVLLKTCNIICPANSCSVGHNVLNPLMTMVKKRSKHNPHYLTNTNYSTKIRAKVNKHNLSIIFHCTNPKSENEKCFNEWLWGASDLDRGRRVWCVYQQNCSSIMAWIYLPKLLCESVKSK